MNDFSDIEQQLRKLRPVAPSEDLMDRIRRELSKPDNCRASVSDASLWSSWLRRFTEMPYKISLGFGLAAATALFIFARVNLDRPKATNLAASSTALGRPSTMTGFVPADFTRVVYRTRDEGLRFPSGSTEPVRRLSSHARETFQWRNPRTGASLRVSYPSDEISLVPISGQ
jgi:hypothetical protein